jgi:type II secretory pathway component PulF
MYWKISVLTKTGKEIVLSKYGRKDFILADLRSDSLTVMAMAPDVGMTLKKILRHNMLGSPKLGPFFIDFSRMLNSGLSVSETARTLSEMTSDPLLKTGMERIRSSINDGYSLRASFESAGIFPKIACVSLEAAEKSGQIPEISRKLGEYFEYLHENKNKIFSSLIYPTTVFIALTAASVIISIKLVPQLGFLIPENQMDSLPMRIFLSYGRFMMDYWWTLILCFMFILSGLWYLWKLHKDKLMKIIFRVPVIGHVLQEIEFARIFLNLFVYVKSGISVTEALANIHSAQETFVTRKLIDVRRRIIDGATMGEAFERDGFFPAFIQQSLKKGEETGKRTEYLYETYKYYDSKSRESVNSVIKFINPALMSLAFAFAGFIASFYVLVYQKLGTMGAGIFH